MEPERPVKTWEEPSPWWPVLALGALALLALGLFGLPALMGAWLDSPPDGLCDGECRGFERPPGGEVWEARDVARLAPADHLAFEGAPEGRTLEFLWCDCSVFGDRMDATVDVWRYQRIDCGSVDGVYLGMEMQRFDPEPPHERWTGEARVIEVAETTCVIRVHDFGRTTHPPEGLYRRARY
ncbi:MAG: hypothetical protein H6828_03285 [Planctomycetes bacterium]|nr:hypothetical protein [Planctomycetota bacterium]